MQGYYGLGAEDKQLITSKSINCAAGARLHLPPEGLSRSKGQLGAGD